MSIQLFVVAGPDKGRAFVLHPGERLQVGRSQATATRLTDPHVSRVHCELTLDGNVVTLNDSGSAGGTFVNGMRVDNQILRHGDVVQVGQTQLMVQGGDPGEESTLAPGALQRNRASTGGEDLDALVGHTLAHYKIESVIARGQSGVVFRASEGQRQSPLALKVLRPEISENEEEIQRFIRAMKTMMPLRHPNLVEIFNAGKTGPLCWIAMEYVDGESLTGVIKRIGVAGMLDWRYALRVAVHIARALDFASEHQIVHRNVTPANIIMRASDKVAKLGDLMLAKALEGTMAQQITRPGQILGEVAYMSPERTRGTGEVDGRSDIYGLGATVYALLTGRPPLEGATLPETVQKIRQQEPERPKKYQLSVPDAFEGIVMKMLAKRPEDRYRSAQELVEQLERVAKFQVLTL